MKIIDLELNEIDNYDDMDIIIKTSKETFNYIWNNFFKLRVTEIFFNVI